MVLATHTSILIEDIRTDKAWPGLLKHEVSLLRLLEKICDGCAVEIIETCNLRFALLLEFGCRCLLLGYRVYNFGLYIWAGTKESTSREL